jgi:hypothetical protein
MTVIKILCFSEKCEKEMEISEGLFPKRIQEKSEAEIWSRSRRYAKGVVMALFQYDALHAGCVSDGKS